MLLDELDHFETSNALSVEASNESGEKIGILGGELPSPRLN